MDKQLFLITYESAHWCGASDTKVVVWAEDGVDAIFKASDHMEDEMWELFADEYMDDGSEGDGARKGHMMESHSKTKRGSNEDV
jgi:hypothetical protein